MSRIFYGVSGRGVWSRGSRLILKERTTRPPNFNAVNLRFLKENTTIPILAVVEGWEEENGRYFELIRRIPGETLESVWGKLSSEEKDTIAKETAEYLDQLRKLHLRTLQCLGGQPLYSAFLLQDDDKLGHGPLSSDDELWAELEKPLKKRGVPEEACRRLQGQMPSAAPYTFTHNDLCFINIMVENGHLTGIIDWESSGYFPVWWEYTFAGIGLGQEDKE